MTFLQPYLLWALPLALLPVVIHLLNRMRYRTMPWAAMRFLLHASRHSVRHARLRHFLLLACRIGVVLALIVALARPLIGGWLGWRLRGAPDTVVLLLDRSASMELTDPRTHVSLRQRALQRLADAAASVAGASRLVLIDSATRQPHELASPAVLPDLADAGPTDTAADIPALLDAAVDYLVANRCGRSELWLATDAQASDWLPNDPRWTRWQSRVAALPDDVRVRVLALNADPDNTSVAVAHVRRRQIGGRAELALTFDLARRGAARESFPLAVTVEGVRTLLEVTGSEDRQRIQHVLDLGAHPGAGQGVVELPADANERDNRWWFAFPQEQTLRAVVVAGDANTGRALQLAAAPAPQLLNQSATLLSPGQPIPWDEAALVVWAAGAPPAQLATFGGTAIVFPDSDEPPLAKPLRVARWQREDGPLAATQDGRDLPVSDILCQRRVVLPGDATTLATFEDGTPLLTRRGSMFWCATVPAGDWSNLDEGRVLVPMLQRLLVAGGERFSRAANLPCDARQPTSGVVVAGARVTAFNRPASEDEPERVDEAAARASFGAVPVTMFEENAEATGRLQSELWRWFVAGMVVLLLAEAVLAMPDQLAPSGKPSREPAREMATR